MTIRLRANLRFGPTVRLGLAGLGGASLLFFGFWSFQLLSTLVPALGERSNLELGPGQFHLARGQGETSATALSILGGGPERISLIQAKLPLANARDWHRLSWDLSGLAPSQDVSLVWVSSRQPRQRSLTPAELAAGELRLAGHPDWQGPIPNWGLLIRGEQQGPLLLRRLSLHQGVPTPWQAVAPLLEDWRGDQDARSGWTPTSFNFEAGATRGRWLTPVSAVALWVGTSLGLWWLLGLAASTSPTLVTAPQSPGISAYSGSLASSGSGDSSTSAASPRSRADSLHLVRRERAVALAVLVLVGWLLLDLRWQWNLAARLQDTSERFGQPGPGLAPLSQDEVPVLRALEQLRRHLPKEPARIFILTEDPRGFRANRLGYHLLPHRLHLGLTDLPAPAKVRPGDLLLVLQPLTATLRHEAPTRRLVGRRHGLAVEALAQIPEFGSLYRVRKED